MNCFLRARLQIATLALFSALGLKSAKAEEVYLPPADFIAQSFENTPEQKVLWFTAETKAGIRKVFGEDYPGLRIRYWRAGDRTAWILEAIGKVKLITTGFLIENERLLQMRVLIYRESHGWEVRYPFFTNQFKGLELESDAKLSQNIDGISGATLSVNALTRLAQLALYLHGQVISE
ncbi:MAG: FMN-binding protein [Verrucomicrobia bacterium]|nr:FMN-binding protein [Verrucomicrobiota bacterium]